ncbi:RHS repeat-associated core domain-containing protein [Ruminococcus sp.]|uniref:RHS repeat-associated core domain-containing protein n=1 Tax=Ruminococcus sp. TaxID=41978 RepID=UPI001B4E2197|nr:RHS repeat-associated core domain-containing protein [Ruminococcus sp.]MBP5433123.1 RHS repeat protein [Ruminococcus sp.]
MNKKFFRKSLSAVLSAIMTAEFGLFNMPENVFAIDDVHSYAVYSDSDIIVNTKTGVFNGNVYSGDKFSYLGNSVCYVNKTLNSDGVSDNVRALSKLDMKASKPDYTELLKTRVSYEDKRSGDTVLKGGQVSIDGSMSVAGKLRIDRTVFSGKGYITADGDIKYDAVQNPEGTEMFLASNNGDITIQGSDLTMNGAIYAPNGKVEINAKHFTFNGVIIAGQIELNGTDITVNEVSDDDNVLLQFGPEIVIKGGSETYKENRKITLDISESAGLGTINTDTLSWSFVPDDDANIGAVKIDEASSDNYRKELIITRPGDYKFVINGEDKTGVPFRYTDTINVVEDIAPVADFTKEFDTTGRSEDGTVDIKLTDNSYSLDGDDIGSRVWSVFFDSDNDGDFSDEEEDIFSTGNESEVSYNARSVGKYRFELHAAEVFSDTIPSLLTEDAYRVADTSRNESKKYEVEVTNEAPESHSGISKAKNVDIVITAGNLDVEDIAEINRNVDEVKSELEDKGFSVNLETMSTSTLTAKDTFAWKEYDHYNYVDRYLPTLDKHIIYDENAIKMLGYGWAPLRDWLFVDDGVSAKRVLSFDMVRDRTDWHSMEGGGFLFNTSIKKVKTESEDPEAEPVTKEIMNGYCIILTSGGFKLIKLTDIDVEEFRNGGINGTVQGAGQVLTSVGVKDVYADYNIKIVANNRLVSVYINDEQLINNFILPDTQTGNGFGPIICHDYHGCSQQSYFTFSNIKMSTVRGSELSDILDGHEWRKSSERFVINLNKEKVFDLNDDQSIGYAAKSLIENDINFVGIGTNLSQKAYENLLNTADGTFIDWYELLKNKELLKKYFLNVLGENDYSVDNMVTTSDEIVYDDYYVDKENDPIGEQTWSYDLDASVYENSSRESGSWTSDKPLTFLEATGIYKVSSKLRDDPTNNNKNLDSYKKWSNEVQWTDGLYVHSKPVAKISSEILKAEEINKYICNLTFEAYDNDALSKDNKGITEERKEWKRIDDSEWMTGTVPMIIDAEQVYLQKYSVRDEQGEWSEPAVELIYAEKTENPDAFRDDELPEITLSVSDYNPCLGDQVMITASATDNSAVGSFQIYVDDKLMCNYQGSIIYDCKKEGVVTVKAVCKDIANNEATATKEVNVEDRRDLEAPEITIDTKNDITFEESKVSVKGTIKDNVKLDSYTVELMAPGESEYTGVITSSDEVNDSNIVSFDTNGKTGQYKLKITAADTSGNKRYADLTVTVSEEKIRSQTNTKTEKPATTQKQDTPAEITIKVSADSAEIGEVVNVDIDASDVDGLTAVKVYKDNKVIGNAPGELRFSETEAKTVTIKVETTDVNNKKTTATKEIVFVDSSDRTNPVAEITAPEAGTVLSGKAAIVGSAYDETSLRKYTLEYKNANAGEYQLILSVSNEVKDGELGVWDTYPLANGVYDLRLTAMDNAGNIFACTAQYQIQNGTAPEEEKVAEELIVFSKPEPSVKADDTLKVEAAADTGLAGREYEVTLAKADGTGVQKVLKRGNISDNGSISAVADSSMLDEGDYTVSIAINVPDGDSVKKDVNVKVEHGYRNADAETVCRIVSPENDEKLSAPSEFVAEVTENAFSKYKFEYAPVGTNEFIEFDEGKIFGSEIRSKLDPTLMENGYYDIRLTAFGSGTKAEDTVTAEISGNMKIGLFTISFADLDFEAAGIPVTLIRTYDSRLKDQNGEFGFGWNLSFNSVKLSISTDQSKNWEIENSTSHFVTKYTIKETKQHKVKIDLANGIEEEFVMKVSPQSQALIPLNMGLSVSYEPVSATGSTLVPVNVSTGGMFYDSGYLLTDEIEEYDPQTFMYTRADGTQYLIDSKRGLISIKTSDGTEIKFSKNGVTSSDGKAIKFVYDEEGRILEASDSKGKKVTYEYGIFGDLVSVMDQTDSNVSFVYKDHYITEIRDADGKMLSKNEYDKDGRLVKTTDANGNAVVYDHDIDGREEVITDRNGGTTRYIYDENGNILSQTDANGNTVTNTYDSNGYLASKTDALGNVTKYKYDASGNMLSLTDAEGHEISNEYDSKGMLVSIGTAGLTVLKIDYTDDGLTSSTTDAMGNKISYEYDSKKQLKSVTDEIGTYMNMTYDSDGNVKTATNGAGATADFTYDSDGNCTSKTVTYNSEGTLKTVTENYEYDAKGHLVKTIDSNGNIVSNEYNSIDKISVATDEKGRQTNYTYDAMGNLTKIAYCDGTSETFEYDKEGRNTSATDRCGRKVTMAYDKVGNLLTKTYPNGKTVTYNYDAAYRLTSTVDTRGAETKYEYDSIGNNTAVTDALGNRTSFAYNDRGQQSSTTDARGNVFRYYYDDNGNRIKTEYPDGSSVSAQYDARGRVTSQTDQNGYTTSYSYDGADRLTSVTDALGNTTKYEYDERGCLVKVTDANGNATSYTYDEYGRVVKTTNALGKTAEASYDESGNILTSTDFAGKVTSFTYDQYDRLVSRENEDGKITYQYTKDGKLSSVGSPSGTTSYSYDNMDGLKKVSYPGGKYIEYTYDDTEVLTSVKTNFGTTAYEYDLIGRLVKVVDRNGIITLYEYDANGNRTAVKYANGIVVTYTYDDLNRLIGETVADRDGAVAAQYEYTLGAAGERTRVRELDRTVDYTYDALYRLTGETITPVDGKVKTYTYTYDAVSNRLTKTEDGEVTNYTYNGLNQLVQENNTVYTYDDAGNLISTESAEKSSNYVYNASNKLLRATVMVGEEVTAEEYTYSYDGSRTSRKIIKGDETTLVNYLNDCSVLTNVLAETDKNGRELSYYTIGADLISMERGGSTYIYLYDGHGSVRGLIDADGKLTDTYNYDAFGNMLERTGDTENSYLYCGEQQDDTTGLYYLRARYMNPTTGTFTSMDTYGGSVFDPISLHKYLYANANPVSYTDPSGYIGLFDTVCASAIGNILFYSISGGIISAGLDLLRQLRIAERTGKEIDWGEFWFSLGFGMIAGGVFGYAGFYAKAISSVLIYSVLGVSSIIFCLLSINQAILDGKAELYDLMAFDILFALLSGYSAFSSFKNAAQCKSASNTAKNNTNTEPDNTNTATSPENTNTAEQGEFLDPHKIRFSQSSCNGSAEIIESMKANGWQGDPIDVVQMPDGNYTTIDNTRLYSAQQAGIDVKVNIHSYDEPLPSADFVDRFTTPKGGVPKTWGDAVTNRINNQNASFRNNNPSGSWEMMKPK